MNREGSENDKNGGDSNANNSASDIQKSKHGKGHKKHAAGHIGQAAAGSASSQQIKRQGTVKLSHIKNNSSSNSNLNLEEIDRKHRDRKGSHNLLADLKIQHEKRIDKDRENSSQLKLSKQKTQKTV